MKYALNRKGIHVTAELSGVFRFDDQDLFRTMLAEIDALKVSEVAIDMHDVSAIDSSGLGMLLLAHTRQSKAGRHFYLSSPAPNVLRVLEAAGVDQVIETRR